MCWRLSSKITSKMAERIAKLGVLLFLVKLWTPRWILDRLEGAIAVQHVNNLALLPK